MTRKLDAGTPPVVDASVDADDIPELTEGFFREATYRSGETIVRRGRPPVREPKQQVTLRFPAETLAKLRARGRGWQSLVVRAVEKELEGG